MASSQRRTGLALILVGVLAALGAFSGLAATPVAQAAQGKKPTRYSAWAPEAKAKIHPGVMMYTAGGQCTANFVFTDKRGNVYVGYAAHCAGKGGATDTNGCDTGSVPLGTKVNFVRGGSIASGGTKLGTGKLAYSSWHTMGKLGTSDANTCEYNDFALAKVIGKHRKRVNPTVPVWGGPTGLDTNGLGTGERVWSYGNSSLRGGVAALSPKVGLALSTTGGGWSHTLYTISPGVPGDSGSGFLSAKGRAIGTLSTIGLAPLPASNGIGNLKRELAFARKHSGIKGLKLAKGTRGFNGIIG